MSRVEVWSYLDGVKREAVSCLPEESWVYVDGKLALEHTAASTGLGVGELWMRPFFFECRSLLADVASETTREHTLAVKVHNWHGAGGLYEPVDLVGSDTPLSRDQLWRVVQEHRQKGSASQGSAVQPAAE